MIVPAEAEEHETHGSRVRLLGDRAFKLRKPVTFAFLDQSTPERRAVLARAEVALNRALAPGTYLGVRAVEIGADGDWAVGAEPCAGGEVVVEMRRFAEADTLAARLDDGRVEPDHLQALGAALARFHAAAPPAPGGGARAALARVHRNIEELVELAGPEHGVEELWRLLRPLTAYGLRHAELLDERAARGRRREGHGDLRADHVVIDDQGLRIVDRLEFDRDLRVDDVAADLGFLLMDLEARGARWAAGEVLAAYRAAGGDAGDERLVAFWGAYRASVTAKVALLRARQVGSPRSAEAGARDRLALARRLAWRTRLPLVLVVCGPPAAGKSTLAAELCERTGLPVVSSDRVRKDLHGVPPTVAAPAEAYADAASTEVYRSLARHAADALGRHHGVIVDATMRTARHRAAFVERLPAGSWALFVECQVPAPLAAARAQARERDPGAVSDATAHVAARLRAAWEPLDEIAAADHLPLRADREPGRVADELESRLDDVAVDTRVL